MVRICFDMSNNNLLEEMVSWQLKATLNITQDLRIVLT